jgi:N-acetylneuraminic acid mutarotase
MTAASTMPGRRALGLLLLATGIAACGTEPATTPTPMPSPTAARPLVDAPSPRTGHSAVWTGSRMIIWGGSASAKSLNDGAAYDPVTNTWTAVSMTGAPSPRTGHVAVWAGSRMIVWGGIAGIDPVTDETISLFDGGVYDPETDTWAPISIQYAPDWTGAIAVSTGSTAILWGGSVRRDGGLPELVNSGRIYDPATNTWTRTSRVGAPDPEGWRQVAVWTGSRMIVWAPSLKRGGSYDPATNSWRPIASQGAPPNDEWLSAVWAGSRLIIWGGERVLSRFDSEATNRGGAYDSESDTWSPTWTKGAPEPRYMHTAVSTGSTMIVWGGLGTEYNTHNGISFASGAIYDPATDNWSPISTRGTPRGVCGRPGLYEHTAVWTGSKMIVWGGVPGPTNAGGVYDPVTDSWTLTALVRPSSP